MRSKLGSLNQGPGKAGVRNAEEKPTFSKGASAEARRKLKGGKPDYSKKSRVGH